MKQDSTMELYSHMIRNKIPPQDSRFDCSHAVAQNMWWTVNLSSLLQWCSKRLCCTMQWEINTLARMVRDCVIQKFPHLGILLKSRCERAGYCVSVKTYAGTDMEVYYQLNAPNNGNKVYYPYEGELCGKRGMWDEEVIQGMLENEKRNLPEELIA
jgi:thymidylate synthase ThyX